MINTLDLQIVLTCSFVAIVSWSIWIYRTRYCGYFPFDKSIDEQVSVIVPVYNEDPDMFKSCISSIIANNPDEIIIANDEFSNNSMQFLDSLEYENFRIITSIHGKRHALADGVRISKYNIIIFSDSDAVWNFNTKEELLKGFSSDDIAGVGTRQTVLNKDNSLAQKVANFMLDTKYLYFQQAMSVKGVVSCLSGRTAAYRKQAVLKVLDNFEHEKFLGKECISGDDTSLTCLILKKGYKTVYQSTAIVESEFPNNFLTLFKMKIRWSRNSYRIYLKSIANRWVFKRDPILWMTMIYIMISPLIIFYMIYIMCNSSMIPISIAMFIVVRFVRGHKNIKNNYKDSLLIPIIAMIIIIFAFLKIYAVLTIRNNRWLTR